LERKHAGKAGLECTASRYARTNRTTARPHLERLDISIKRLKISTANSGAPIVQKCIYHLSFILCLLLLTFFTGIAGGHDESSDRAVSVVKRMNPRLFFNILISHAVRAA
jgi:hypothetical protein